MLRSTVVRWLLLLAGSLAATPAWADVPNLKDIKVAVPKVRGRASWGADVIRRQLVTALRTEVTVIEPDAYEAVEKQATGGPEQPTKVSREGMAAVGRLVGAQYVLTVEITKTGFLYTAHARLVNTANAEFQMDFRSGYYRPQAEASDRADRIARTTVAKIKVLLAPPPAVSGTVTSTVGGGEAVAVVPTPPVTPDGPMSDDDRIFGGSTTDSGSLDDSVFGSASGSGGLEGPGSVAEIDRRLDELDSRVEAGGRLFLRLNYFVADEDVLLRSRLASPSLLDLFMDARVNDRVRGYAQVRIFHDVTLADGAVDAFGAEQDQTRFLFDQLWLKFDVGRLIYVTLGRQRVKWGVGRFWNPTDFLNPEVRDPLSVFDERLGVSLVRLHLPVESLGWNFYAVATFDETDLLQRVGVAGRAEVLVGNVEFSLSFAARRDGPTRFGMDISAGVGPFDLRAEGAFTYNSQRDYYEGSFDPAAGVLPNAASYADELIPQGLVGAELSVGYNDGDTAYLGIEYFYNGRGYRNGDLYPYMVFQDLAARQNCVGLACPGRAFQPLYMGRHYGAAYLSLPKPGSWDDTTFTGTYLGNFDDGSMTARLDYELSIFSFLVMSVYAQGHFGKRGELKFGADIAPVPGFPGLENGFVVADPILELGSGFSIAF